MGLTFCIDIVELETMSRCGLQVKEQGNITRAAGGNRSFFSLRKPHDGIDSIRLRHIEMKCYMSVSLYLEKIRT